MKFTHLFILIVHILADKCRCQLNVLSPEDQTWNSLITNFAEELQDYRAQSQVITALHNILAALKSSSFPTAVAKNISQQCINDSQLYVHNLFVNTSLWALQMKESSGQFPPGLFGSYNVHADGLFDECLAIRAPEFKGQYCTVFFKPTDVDESDILPPPKHPVDDPSDRSNFITIFQILGLMSPDRVEPKVALADPGTYILPSISFCLPSSCSADDLGQAVAQLVGSYVIGNKSIVTVADEGYCFKESGDPPNLDGSDITAIMIFSLLGFVILLATVHEAWRMYKGGNFESKKDGYAINALHCFSALHNGRKILSMKVTSSSSNDNFGCIHGIRFLSTCWVVLGHTWGHALYSAMNLKAVKEDAYGFGIQTITNATVAVDTFFVMSGLLVAYLLLRELERNKGKFNVALYYVHRYLRLTPVYALIICLIATFMFYMGTGPNWYTVNYYSKSCRANWWMNIFYGKTPAVVFIGYLSCNLYSHNILRTVNNFFPTDEYVCMGHTWYLAVDMQLYLIAPLIVYPLWRWKIAGLAWLGVVALACQMSIFAVYAIYDLIPTPMYTRLSDIAYWNTYFQKYYLNPWTRAPPYFIGMWIGWFLHVTKKSPPRISKSLVTVGWALAIAVMVAVIYGLYPYLDEDKVPEIDPAVIMTYGPLHRTAWAIALVWIIYACSRGYGGFVNRFLSWKGFLPLGRLTYCVYLIHYDYLNVYFSALRKQYYYTMRSEFTLYFGLLVTVFGFAFVASVTLEAPFLNLEKLVFSPRSENKTQHGTSKK